MVESYPHLFRELVGQLFENSLVHGVPGTAGGRITIGIGIGVKDGMVSLVFGDNGRGMDSLAMEHLYEPFFTTALAEGHVGLGLHTVYNIVRQQLGGTIECKSDPRAGTCFTMVFPAKTFRPDERDTPASGPRDPLDRFH
jgi:signal transduction histidine kinase